MARTQREPAVVAPTNPTREDFEEALRFDKNDLDTALLQHSDLYYRVGEELARAVSERDYSKLRMDETTARVARQLREDALKAGEKTTEKGIEMLLTLDAEVKEATRDYLDDKYKADRWANLKDAYEQRSGALKRLVELFVTGYFGDRLSRATDKAQTEYAETRESLARHRNQGKTGE